MLKPLGFIGFLLLDLVMLVGMLALGLMCFAALSTDPVPFGPSLLSTSEVFRAFAGSVGFMILSGYFVSAGALTLIFRNRLFSLVRAIWLALLFVAHAIAFLFYLMGPAVPTTSALLIAIGVACVVVVTILENALWRTWI